MSGAKAALEVLRQAGLKVEINREPVDPRTPVERFGSVWLMDIEDGKFKAELAFQDDQPVVILSSQKLLPRFQTYYFASFIASLARNRDFHVQMLEGAPTERISMRDVHVLVERGMSLLDKLGTMEARFTEYDPDLPF